MLTLIPSSSFILFPLLIMAVFLASFFRSRSVKIGVIVVMTVFLLMEMISIYFSGGYVNYQFYVNLNVDDIIEGLSIFKIQALLSGIVFFILVFGMIKFSSLLSHKLNSLIRLMVLVISVMTLNFSNGPFSKLWELYQVVSAPKIEFTNALENLHWYNYVDKKDLKAQAGKNIIVISLESLEQGFLDDKSITPNLNRLTKQYHLYPNIPMNIGSSWTTASMYTYMTGMPFLVGGMNTKPLSDVSQTQLVSLGDVLHQANYQTRYIIGDPQFAGIGHIISLFDIEIISEKSYPNEYPKAPFGLYDKDIFDIAKRQVDKLSKSDQPFALFISSISTHAPNGFYDERMTSVIDPNLDSMSFAIASLDYNLGNFMDYLQKQGILEDTVFYIFPDHLMMGSGTQTIAHLSKKTRALYLLTNAKPSDMAQYALIPNNIYQIDLPRIILNGARLENNARFYTDSFLIEKASNRKAYVEKNIVNIATLNRSAGVE